LGVPALLPQRRELGWPNRGAATTPGADVGGAPIMGGPRVDRRGQHEVDDGPRLGQITAKATGSPRVGLLTQYPHPRGPRTGGPGLL